MFLVAMEEGNNPRPSLAANAVAPLPPFERRGAQQLVLEQLEVQDSTWGEALDAACPEQARAQQPTTAAETATPAQQPQQTPRECCRMCACMSARCLLGLEKADTKHAWLKCLLGLAVFAQELWWIFSFGSHATSVGTPHAGDGGRGYCYQITPWYRGHRSGTSAYAKLRGVIKRNFVMCCLFKGALLLDNALRYCGGACRNRVVKKGDDGPITVKTMGGVFVVAANWGEGTLAENAKLSHYRNNTEEEWVRITSDTDERAITAAQAWKTPLNHAHGFWSLYPYVKNWVVFKRAPQRGLAWRASCVDGQLDLTSFRPMCLQVFGTIFAIVFGTIFAIYWAICVEHLSAMVSEDFACVSLSSVAANSSSEWTLGMVDGWQAAPGGLEWKNMTYDLHYKDTVLYPFAMASVILQGVAGICILAWLCLGQRAAGSDPVGYEREDELDLVRSVVLNTVRSEMIREMIREVQAGRGAREAMDEARKMTMRDRRQEWERANMDLVFSARNRRVHAQQLEAQTALRNGQLESFAAGLSRAEAADLYAVGAPLWAHRRRLRERDAAGPTPVARSGAEAAQMLQIAEALRRRVGEVGSAAGAEAGDVVCFVEAFGEDEPRFALGSRMHWLSEYDQACFEASGLGEQAVAEANKQAREEASRRWVVEEVYGGDGGALRLYPRDEETGVCLLPDGTLHLYTAPAGAARARDFVEPGRVVVLEKAARVRVSVEENESGGGGDGAL
jgi:hypothetical protein